MATKVKVSKRALIQRINRKLAKQDEKLITARENSNWLHNTGRYYVIDISKNMLLYHDVDLETLGRELGALHEYEELYRSR